MIELPNRKAVTGEDFDDLPSYLADVLLPIAMAFRAEELKTEKEWREYLARLEGRQ